MSSLADRRCTSCREGTPKLGAAEAQTLLCELDPRWRIENDQLKREFKFPDFASALAFTNQIGSLAEQEDHHPDIHLAWGRVALSLWTHTCKGLGESDFILAAKIDRLANLLPRGS